MRGVEEENKWQHFKSPARSRNELCDGIS